MPECLGKCLDAQERAWLCGRVPDETVECVYREVSCRVNEVLWKVSKCIEVPNITVECLCFGE